MTVSARRGGALAAGATVVVAAVLLAAVACSTSTGGEPRHEPARPPGQSPEARSQGREEVLRGSGLTVRSVSGRPLDVRPVLQLALPDTSVSLASLTGHTLLFGSGLHGEDTDRVSAVDVRDGTSTVVARSAWRRGLTQGAVSTGHWVVYSDQDRTPNTWDLRNRWRLHAVDPRTGSRRVLAGSGRRPEPWVAQPRSDDEVVVWSEPEPRRQAGLRVRMWRPGWSMPRDVLRRTRLVPGSESVVDGMLVFLAESGGRVRYGLPATDVFAKPLAGGRVVRLSDHGMVDWVAASAGGVVWSQRRRGRSVARDDPFSHWSRPLDRSAPPTMVQRGYSGSNVVAGDAFVAWWPDGGGVQVSTYDGTSQALIRTGPEYVPYRLAADGDLLTFATQRGRGPITLHVVRVTTPP